MLKLVQHKHAQWCDLIQFCKHVETYSTQTCRNTSNLSKLQTTKWHTTKPFLGPLSTSKLSKKSPSQDFLDGLWLWCPSMQDMGQSLNTFLRFSLYGREARIFPHSPILLICHKYLQYVLDQLLPKLPIKLCAQKCGHVGRAKFFLVIELTWHGLHAFLTNSSSGQVATWQLKSRKVRWQFKLLTGKNLTLPTVVSFSG